MIREGHRAVPLVSCLDLEDGLPRLRGHRCSSCQAIFLDARMFCGNCGERNFDIVLLPIEGEVVSFSIVFRAPPGIDVPYVPVIVELDSKLEVRGNLIGVEPDAEQVGAVNRVRLTTYEVAQDDIGQRAIAYAFERSTSHE